MSPDATTFDAARQTDRLNGIKEAVAEHFGISVADMLVMGRLPKYSWARHVSTWIGRRTTGASYPALIRAFPPRKHHKCAMNSYDAVENRRDVDPAFRAETDALLSQFTQPQPEPPK
jgi:chromosomal replication initiation ATPase DnaA